MRSASKIGGLALAALVLTTCSASALQYQIDTGPVLNAPQNPGPVYEQAPPDVTMNAPDGLDLTFELANPVQVNTPNLPGTTPPTLKKRSFGGSSDDIVVAVSCEVAGGANALSDDLMLVNRGNATLEAGTTIKWNVRSTRLQGFFALNKPIAAGQGFKASDILDRSVEAGAPCTAKIV